eukprot:SAG31_NODE_1239_length_9169_cov_18.922492_17_plen_85_part_00
MGLKHGNQNSRNGGLAELAQHDELGKDLARGQNFYKYKEPQRGPNFFPTYKLIPGRSAVVTTLSLGIHVYGLRKSYTLGFTMAY